MSDVEKAWADFTGGTIYEGPAEISVSGCTGTDTWRITVKQGGTLELKTNVMIHIVGTSSSNCTWNITHDYPQTAYGTYSNGTFTMNEDGSTGHYDSQHLWPP